VTTPGSYFDDAILQIVARLQADATLTAGGWVVFDGEDSPGDDDTRIIYVGWDGDKDGDRLQVTDLQLAYRGLGANRQDERFGIPCSLFVLGKGDAEDAPGMRETRATARDGFGAVVKALGSRANNGLGFPGPARSGVTDGRAYAEVSLRRYRIAFTVSVSARI
jgi:hypothetical protein